MRSYFPPSTVAFNQLLSAWQLAVRYCQTTFHSLSDATGRRRLLILVAATLVCGYAIGVFSHVVTTPDLGLRFAFSPVVKHVSPGFLVAPAGDPEPNLLHKEVVQIGHQRIDNWPQLLRAQLDLAKQPIEGSYHGALPPPDESCIIWHDEKLVRIKYRDSDEAVVQSVWCRVKSPPLDSSIPAILWLLLKSGLFAVGMLVFWKRPLDRSAAQFFLLCMVTFGAYIGGYHWWQVLTQPDRKSVV